MPKQNKVHIVVIMICGVLIFFFGHRLFFISPGIIKQTASCFVYPVLLLQRHTLEPLKTWFESRAQSAELQAIIDGLCAERDILLEENITLRATKVYAEDTKELREFSARYDNTRMHTAQILARHFSDRAHFFLIDEGANHGIAVDMVAVYCNCLIGRVIEVYPWYSKIRLITDASCKIAACCTRTKASGIHEGSNKEGETYLNFVSHLDQVVENDIILSSGEGLVFPQGFALGHIDIIETDDLYHHIRIKPLVDLRKLRYCQIIAKGSQIDNVL